MDQNTTLIALEVATNRLNWYIALSIVASVISVIAIVISFLVHKKQLKSNQNHLEANHDWNKRSFSTLFLKDLVNELNKTRGRLDTLTEPSKKIIKDANGVYINFTTWREANKKLLPATIHEWVCEEHGAEYKRVEKADYNPCVTTKEKEEIIINILHLINIYEQIGSSLKNNVLDKDILFDLMHNPIKYNYELFRDYIQHRIDDHGDLKFGNSFKWVYEELESKKRDPQRESTSK